MPPKPETGGKPYRLSLITRQTPLPVDGTDMDFLNHQNDGLRH